MLQPPGCKPALLKQTMTWILGAARTATTIPQTDLLWMASHRVLSSSSCSSNTYSSLLQWGSSQATFKWSLGRTPEETDRHQTKASLFAFPQGAARRTVAARWCWSTSLVPSGQEAAWLRLSAETGVAVSPRCSRTRALSCFTDIHVAFLSPTEYYHHRGWSLNVFNAFLATDR